MSPIARDAQSVSLLLPLATNAVPLAVTWPFCGAAAADGLGPAVWPAGARVDAMAMITPVSSNAPTSRVAASGTQAYRLAVVGVATGRAGSGGTRGMSIVLAAARPGPPAGSKPSATRSSGL